MPHKASTLGSLAPGTVKPRLSANARGYDRHHQRWRKIVLAANPVCCMCQRARSTHADHKIPHGGDWRLRFSIRNGQGLCHKCHSIKTAKHDGGFGNPIRKGKP
jgi:5-methylcytosine-specific restriction protein A